MRKLAEGDHVRISDREAVAADVKSQLFFPHYRGLSGTLTKLFADNTAVVTVDPESLPADVRARHESDTARTRQKWLDGLSDEARNRLSAGEKKFSLRYTVLAAVDDLTAEQAKPAPQAPPDRSDESAPTRKSLADLEVEEARHLEEKAKKRK